jgi:hypothetical protein
MKDCFELELSFLMAMERASWKSWLEEICSVTKYMDTYLTFLTIYSNFYSDLSLIELFTSQSAQL